MRKLRWRWFTIWMLTVTGTLLAGAVSLGAAPRGENVVGVAIDDLPDISWHPIPTTATGAVLNGRRLRGFHLVRDGERWIALAETIGWYRECRVRWREFDHVFVDPCEGSQFNLRGELVHGLSIRGLYQFPVTVTEDGYVLVDVAHSN